MEPAIALTQSADIFCVIGTSLAVYPAASLLYYVSPGTRVFLIDPYPPTNIDSNIQVIRNTATLGVAEFVNII